jgi:hypothetical protein
MPSLPLLKALGLNFSPNQLEVAPGSLVEASNVIIRRDNVIESRRGYSLYGTAMGTGTDRCKQLTTYKSKLIRHFANRLQYENGLNNAGTVSFFDFNEIVNGVSQQAVITEAQAGLRIKSIEANSNLYLTTSDGIKKISSKSASTFPAANITNAGGVKALDGQAFLNTTIGDQASFLPPDSGVAYKIVWGTKDASNNLILGTPSDPITILNPLLDLTLKDFSNFLLQIDNMVNVGNSIFPTPSDYYSTLALPIDATSVELRDKLILLSTKLDEDLLFATASGTGAAYQPLGLLASASTTAATTNGLNTITVASATGITIGMRVEGSNVVYGLVTNVVGTTVTLSSPAASTTAATPVTFYGTVVSSGVTNVHFSPASTPSNYFIAGDKINIPVNIGASVFGFTSNGVGVDGVNTNHTVTSVGSDKIVFNAANYSSSNPNGISGTITNSTTGGPGSITVTAPNHGLKNNQKITISGTTALHGTYVITYLTPDTFSVNSPSAITTAQTVGIWDIVIDGISTAKIESYTFRSIEVPVEQSIPATNAQLVSVQNYYSEILLALQDFIAARGNNIVNATDYAAYLQNLDVTSSSSVTLKITIPPAILQYSAASNPYFYQIYRTDIAIVDGVSTISGIAIIQEYTQIEEKFPTAGELSSGIVTYLDNTPESIAGTGANLYTNERTGEGGLQANDVPPFALDINQFKGYTFFSNTRTRQRKSLTLIGVVNMINNYNPADPYKLTISNGTTTNTYSFVVGAEEITQLTCGSGAALASSGNSDYFLLYSANNENQYYVWYQVGTSVDPAVNSNGIKVVVLVGDSANTVASKTAAAISNILSDFSAVAALNVVTITNKEVGLATNASFPTSTPVGFSLNVTQQGVGEDVSTKKVLLSPDASVGIAIEETAKSLIRVINQNASEFISAFYISGTETTPGTILLESRNLSSDEFYVMGSDSIIGESFNPDLSPGTITITAISAANPTLITTGSNHNLLNGDSIVISNSNSTPSIDGVYQITYVSATQFTIPVNVTVAGTSAAFESIGVAEVSSNEEQPHRVYYSKFQQPEAVPILN